MDFNTASLDDIDATPVSVWQKLIAEQNLKNKLVIAYESGTFFAGFIDNIEVSNNHLILTPTEIWRMTEKGWKKMNQCFGWDVFDEWLFSPEICGEFFRWSIGDVANIYIYTGDIH